MNMPTLSKNIRNKILVGLTTLLAYAPVQAQVSQDTDSNLNKLDSLYKLYGINDNTASANAAEYVRQNYQFKQPAKGYAYSSESKRVYEHFLNIKTEDNNIIAIWRNNSRTGKVTKGVDDLVIAFTSKKFFHTMLKEPKYLGFQMYVEDKGLDCEPEVGKSSALETDSKAAQSLANFNCSFLVPAALYKEAIIDFNVMKDEKDRK